MTTSYDPVARLVEAAVAAMSARDLDGALLRFAAARRLAPTNPGLLRSVSALACRTGRWAEAWSAAECGLRLQPGDAGFEDDRLAALSAGGLVDMALPLAAAWALSAPKEPQARWRHGSLLLQAGAAAEALEELEAALATRPDWPEALVTAAEAAFRCGAHPRARVLLDRAVALEPENRVVRMARATMLLSLGIWDPGLQDYEYRLRPDANREIKRDLSLPRWTGDALSGRTLLVVAEQGIGDQIRFARDLVALRRLTGRLIVECTPRLVPILRRSLPDTIVAPSIERQEGRVHHFDYSWLAGLGTIDYYIEAGSVMLRLHELGLPPDRPTEPGIPPEDENDGPTG